MGQVEGQAATLQVEMVCLDELIPKDDGYRKLVPSTGRSFASSQRPTTPRMSAGRRSTRSCSSSWCSRARSEGSARRGEGRLTSTSGSCSTAPRSTASGSPITPSRRRAASKPRHGPRGRSRRRPPARSRHAAPDSRRRSRPLARHTPRRCPRAFLDRPLAGAIAPPGRRRRRETTEPQSVVRTSCTALRSP